MGGTGSSRRRGDGGTLFIDQPSRMTAGSEVATMAQGDRSPSSSWQRDLGVGPFLASLGLLFAALLPGFVIVPLALVVVLLSKGAILLGVAGLLCHDFD